MPKFRKKPVEIEAVPVREVLSQAWADLPDWVATADDEGTLEVFDDHILIQTLEGEHRGDAGDWLVRGVKGELYPVKPDIFTATYDPVD